MKTINYLVLILILGTFGLSFVNTLEDKPTKTYFVTIDRNEAAKAATYCSVNKIEIKKVYSNLPILEVEFKGSLKELKAKFALQDVFINIEENKTHTATLDFIPNDPSFSGQWFLRQSTDKDIDADEMWDILPNNSHVTVAMLDGGIEAAHPDLASNIETPFNAVTNQFSNGEFVNISDRHGTACSGVIASVNNNNIGISGVGNNKVKVMPINIMSNTNGSSFSTTVQIQVNALNAAAANPNCVAVAMSYSSNTFSSTLELAFEDLANNGRNGKGIFLCASTGNGYSGTATNYPANYKDVYGIGATTSNDVKSGFSNFGNIVDISAPGSAILTTDRLGTAGYNSGDYATVSGTSFSCPLTAACGALLIYKNQSLTEAEVMSVLAQTAEKVGNYTYDYNPAYPYSTRSIQLGYGRINIKNAIAFIEDDGNPPPPPTPVHNIIVGGCGISDQSPELNEMIALTAIQTTSFPSLEAVQSIIQFRISNDATWSDDDLIVKSDTVTLGGGITSVASSAVYTPTTYGTKYFLAKGDVNNAIAEPVETDNTCGVSYNVIIIPQSVDLAVEILSNPWSGCSNTPQPQFRYRFRNVGTENINSFTWKLYWLNDIPSAQINTFNSGTFGITNLIPGAVTPTFVQGFNYTTMPEGFTITRMVEVTITNPADLNTINNTGFNTYTRMCNGTSSDNLEINESGEIKVLVYNYHNLKQSFNFKTKKEAEEKLPPGFYILHIYYDDHLDIIKIVK